MTKLEWCKANAPEALKILSDVELMEMMSSSYERFCSEKEIDENSMESVEYDKNDINNHLDYMVLELVREFGNNLAFKGGYMLTKLMDMSARQTTDIDFSIASLELYEDIKLVLDRIGTHFVETGIVDMYKVKEAIQPRMSGGADFYLDGKKVLGVDVGWHDTAYGTKLTNIGIATVNAFQIERMLSDKITAILSRKRFRRPKDLYDLYCISEVFNFDIGTVHAYILTRTEGADADWCNFPFSPEVLREYEKAFNKLSVKSIYLNQILDLAPFEEVIGRFNRIADAVRIANKSGVVVWNHESKKFSKVK